MKLTANTLASQVVLQAYFDVSMGHLLPNAIGHHPPSMNKKRRGIKNL